MAAVDRELAKSASDMDLEQLREQLGLEGVPFRDDRAIVTQGRKTQTISLPDDVCEAQNVTPEDTQNGTTEVPILYWKEQGIILIDTKNAE